MDKKFSVYMFIAMTLWAGSWVSGKLISTGELHFQFIFWRFVITAVCYFIIYFFSKQKDQNSVNIAGKLKKSSVLILVIISAMVLVGYNTLFIMGLKSGLAGKGGVIVTTLNPLIGFILGAVIYRNKFSGKTWLGMIIGLTGGIILIEPWKYSINQLIDGGNLIFIAASGFWAVLTALGHKLQKELSLWEFNLLIYTIAIFLTIPFIWNKNIFIFEQYSAGFWINTFYLAVMAGTIAGGMYFHASKVIGSARAGSFTFIVPGMALLFSYIFLNEIPEVSTVIGGAMAIGAVYIINKSK